MDELIKEVKALRTAVEALTQRMVPFQYTPYPNPNGAASPLPYVCTTTKWPVTTGGSLA